jgi:hypothetical protein
MTRMASYPAWWVFGGLILAACGGSGGDAPGATSAAQGSGGGTATSGSGTTAGNGGASSSTTTSTTTTATSAASTGSGGTTFAGTTRVDAAGKAIDRSADVVVGPDGSIYVSWVDGANKVLVARSTDGGAKFGAPVTVNNDKVVPLVSMARHPRMATDGKRVAIAVGEQSGALHLYIANADIASFGVGITIGADVNTMFRDFAKPVFLADGSLAVAWHGFPATGAREYLSRESKQYAAEVASGGAPGVPCECCPLDVALLGGDLVLAFRNNDNNTRDMWVATAPKAAAFSSFKAGSTTEGLVPMCPMQGPRVLDTGAGKLLMAWSARGKTSPGAVMLSSGTTTGTWTGGAPIMGFAGDEPTLALGASGKIYAAAVTGSMKSGMVTSADGGKTWGKPEPITTPDGDLSTPQATSTGGVAVLAGETSKGTVWLKRME